MLNRTVVTAALIGSLVCAAHVKSAALHLTFATGDVLVSLERGPIQWWLPDGTLNQVLIGQVVGTGEGMGFDSAGNLYVTRWCSDVLCQGGNTVEEFNSAGQSLGSVGAGYDCGPHAIVFDDLDRAFVGQAGCSGDVLKFAPGMTTPMAFAVAAENQGSFWVDLAPDRCTLYYTSSGPDILRFDTCDGKQVNEFNQAPLPGGITEDLRLLPDGGVLVSSGAVVARLNASGALVQSYGVAESTLWAGVDLVGDGTFWAANYETSNLYRFDLGSGAIVSSIATGMPPHTIVGVRVKK